MEKKQMGQKQFSLVSRWYT